MDPQNGRVPERGSFFDFGGNYAFRRGTFKRWPYQKEEHICHPIYMSLEWWRSTGESDVRCVVCMKELEGWEEQDDPFKEHMKHSKSCPVAIAHTFLQSLPAEFPISEFQTEEQVKAAYLKWVNDMPMLSPKHSRPVSPENGLVTVVKGKRGRQAKKTTTVKKAASVNYDEGDENLLTGVDQSSRKRPTRQVKTTMKTAQSVPSLATAIKKPLATTKKPIMTFDELCVKMESLMSKVTEKHLVKDLLDQIRDAGSIMD